MSFVVANILVASALAYAVYVFIKSGIGIRDAIGREVEAITTTVLVFEFLYLFATWEKSNRTKTLFLSACFTVAAMFYVTVVSMR